jgi:hypothetical protein
MIAKSNKPNARATNSGKTDEIVLVEPIRHVFYAVSILDVDIPAVRLGDIIRLQPAQVVAIHENWHAIPPVAAAVGSPREAIAIFAGCALACLCSARRQPVT